MRVGTDGTLLGAWANGGRSILDIGTGTGLIALMMAQRFAEAEVVGIDIDAECCRQATLNVAASPFSSRISIEQADINDYAERAERRFDAVVVNPPYFVHALQCPSESRSTARHSASMPFPVLFAAAARLLAAEGSFSAIIPSASLAVFMSEAALHGFCLCRKTDITTVAHKPASRHLLEYRLKPYPVATESQCLCCADGSRSEWYSRLTEPFYKW